jgi:hypothetical protein
VNAAKSAITEGKKELYYGALKNVMNAVIQGKEPSGILINNFTRDIGLITKTRSITLNKDTSLRRIVKLDSKSLFDSFQYLPNLQKEYAKDLPESDTPDKISSTRKKLK